MNTIISLQNIRKEYNGNVVLDDVNIEIAAGEFVSVVGESGAGKSTLMNIVGALDSDYVGRYYFENELITKQNQNTFRNRHIGFLFQQFNLLPLLTARENVMFPYLFCREVIPDVEKRCDELFKMFDMTKKCNQKVNTMSGGEKQRVALLRSIIMNPEIILADEPTGNLDKKNALLVRDFLKEMNRKGKTVIVVTHDLEFAGEAQRYLQIGKGKVSER